MLTKISSGSSQLAGRIVFTSLVLASLIATLSISDRFVPPTQSTSDLVGYWKFDEASGSALDSSGNGFNGSLENGATRTTGLIGSAISLDGNDDFVDVGNQSALVMTGEATFSAWIYPTGPGGDTRYGGSIISKEGEYVIARYPNGTIQWAIAPAGCSDWFFSNTGGVAPLNQWTHVAVSYESGLVKSYINGTMVHAYAGSGNIGDINTSLNDFHIGGRYSQNFQGRIDEVKVYNRALSANEIAGLAGDGSVGYWKFDDGSGTAPADSSGNGHTGALISGASWTTGHTGTAISFNGSSGYVKISDGKISSSNTGTISAWVKVNSLVNAAKIVGYGGAAASSVQAIFGLETRQDGSNYYFSVVDVPADGAANANSAHGSTVLQTGVWYHVALTSDGSTWKLYVNGVAETMTNQLGSGNTGKWFGNTTPTGPDKTYIGAVRFNGSDSGIFNGLIDEVRIYDRAFAASEVATLAGGPVGHWKFDDGTGTTAADFTGNNPGELISGASWTTNQSGSAISLNGSSGYVKIKDGKISSSTSGTISGWVKVNSLVNAAKIVGYGGAAASSVQAIFGLETRQDGSNYYFSVIDVAADGGNANSAHGSTVLQTGVWYHVALTSDGSTWKLYVNGVAETMTNQLGSGNTGKWFGNTTPTSPDKTYIGAVRFNGSDSGIFNGLIDEVRIYDRALSAGEVAALTGPPTGNGFWQKYGNDPVLPVSAPSPEEWDSNYWLAIKSIVKTDPACSCPAYYGYYHARNNPSGGPFQIGLATSNDGIAWTRQNPNAPIFSPNPTGGTWDDYEVGDPLVWREGSNWYMLYAGNDTAPAGGANGVFNVGLATSSDGITWSRDSHNPVLEAGDQCGWDAIFMAPTAILKEGGVYYLYYFGFDHDYGYDQYASYRIGLATSTDLISWTKHKDANNVCEPVLTGTSGAWDRGVLDPYVQKVGSTYYMWYQGNNGLSDDLSAIGLATSSDRIHWTKSATNPILFARACKWDNRWTETPILLDIGAEWRLYYSGSGGGTPTMQTGFATWTPR